MNTSRSCYRSQAKRHEDSGVAGLLSTALDYADRYGWSVIPVTKKKAVGQWKKYQADRPTVADLRKMFSRRSVTGLALISGGVSDRLRIRDYDVQSAYDEWAASHPTLAKELPTVKTRKGAHVYYRADLPDCVRKCGDGEVRAGGGYTLAPPSAHPDGGGYAWIIEPSNGIPWLDDPVSEGLALPAEDVLPRKARVRSEIQDASSFQETPQKPQNPSNTSPGVSETSRLSSIAPCEVDYSGGQHPDLEFLAKLHQPTGGGQRHRRIFDYAQAVKGLPGEWGPRERDAAFWLWWADAKHVVLTNDDDLSFAEFHGAFERVQFAGGIDWPDVLRRSQAEALPVDEAGCPLGTQTIIRVCAVLQRHHGDKPFYLSGEIAGGLLGKGLWVGGQILRTLVRRGVLRLVEKGSNQTGKASTYFYLPTLHEVYKITLRADRKKEPGP